MITLSLEITNGQRIIAKTISEAEREFLIKEIDATIRSFEEITLDDKLKANFEKFKGDDGIFYEKINFYVESFYYINNELWIQGGGFRVNIHATFNASKNMLLAWIN